MLRLIKYLILAPVAVLLLAFAFANRDWVTVSFDPFASGDDAAAFSLSAPLFLVIVASIMIGVVAGGVSTWFAQGRHRREVRQFRVDADKLRAELQAAKAAQTSLPHASRRV
jgi:uncharacterized integral membrane protein